MSSFALLAGMAHVAMADNLTVTSGSTVNTPLETAKASNNGPGNITIDLGAHVAIPDPGAAVTINSNNSVDHSGTLESLANSGAIGVYILGGFAGNFTAQGSAGAIINVIGSGTGNYGLLLDGASPFVGNITLQPASALIVYGENSVGVAIDAILTGNLTTGAALQGTGLGVTGVKITREIMGTYVNSGPVSVRGTNLYTAENVDPLSGSGIAIGASISQGFLNSGPVSGSDSSSAIGRVTNSSTAPTVIVAPSVAGASGGNITLGAFAGDTARLGFSFMNRGNITASENDTGISTTGVQLGETGTTSLSVLLTNGLYNRGSIQSSSQSDNFLSTTATAVPTNAVGLLIGNGATINPYGSVPPPSGVPQVTTAGWDTTAGSGSTTTTIVLGANASEVDGIYEGLKVTVGSETRTVTDYVVVRDENGTVTSKTLTLDTALTTAPASGTNLNVNVPNTAVALSPSASDISGAYNGFTIRVGSESRVISDYTVIYDPVSLQPTLKIAQVKSGEGINWPWSSDLINNTPVSITASALFNNGSISASTSGNKGGVVDAILIQPGGRLPSITNYGAIDAVARTTDTTIAALSATAINDQSGTLNFIANHGRIFAQATTLDNGAQIAVAADLSRSAETQRFYVLSGGDVTGDIIFGSKPLDTVNPESNNRLIIEGSVTRTSGNVTTTDHSNVSGSVRAVGSLDIFVSGFGTGGILRTSNTQASTLLVGSNGHVQFALDKNTGSTNPLIATTHNMVFATGSSIEITPTSFLPANGTYKLLSPGAGHFLIIENFNATTHTGSSSRFPFLYQGLYTAANGTPINVTSGGIVASGLNLTLTRKTATQLGLQGNAAAIYEPLAEAALGDDEIGAALLRLTNAEQVNSALATTIPDIAGGMRALTVAMTDQATGVIGARQRSLLTAPAGTRNEFRFWGQEFYNIVGFNSSDGQHGFGGAGQGVSVGVEWGALESGGRWGAGYTFFSSQEVEDRPRDTKTNGDWNMLSAYGAWRINDFFVAPQVNVGMGDFRTRRAIIVGNVGRLARAKTTSYLAAGGATAGYVLEIGNIDIIPTIAFDMMYLNQSAYQEGGGGGASLLLKSQTQTSIRSFAGVIGQGSYSYNEGAFMPQLLAGWSHEFANDPVTIDGSFESSPGSPFRLVGPTLDANKIVGGMSLGYVMRNWSAGFNYDASASRGSLAQSATFSISSRF